MLNDGPDPHSQQRVRAPPSVRGSSGARSAHNNGPQANPDAHNHAHNHAHAHAHDARLRDEVGGRVAGGDGDGEGEGEGEEESQGFHCSHCGKEFEHLSWLQRHENTHTGNKPFKCPHPGCGRAFGRYDRAQTHYLVHTEALPFKCERCGKAFADGLELERHAGLHHHIR